MFYEVHMAKPPKPSQKVIDETIRDFRLVKKRLSGAEKQLAQLKATVRTWAGEKPAEYEATDGDRVVIREKSRTAYKVKEGTYLEVGFVKAS